MKRSKKIDKVNKLFASEEILSEASQSGLS
jgi:hypothetical protein